MKRLLILTAAVSIAACHSRTEDQAGAAPDTGDTTGVTHATVTTDSVLGDTTGVRVDTTMQQKGPQDLDEYQTDSIGGPGVDTTGTQVQ
jgi:hypothetical protein